MILGLWYLTSAKEEGAIGSNKLYMEMEHIYYALDKKILELRAKIKYIYKDTIIETTPGRLIFNEILPEEYPYLNRPLTNNLINSIIIELYRNYDRKATIAFLDNMKNLGFQYATNFAPTFSIVDIKIPETKYKQIEQANKEIEKVEKEYRNGIITYEEKYKKSIEIWTGTNERITESLFTILQEDEGGFNPIYAMVVSGAKGSKSQIRQLAGMRGLMAKPSGDIIELPIRSNFKEGLGVLEFFISTHGARKGLADTALKTADAGYLTRRLADISQDVIVKEYDCGSTEGYPISATKEGDKVAISLGQKIYGRFLAEDIIDVNTEKVVYKSGTLIDDSIAEEIERLGYEEVYLRSVLKCEISVGICSKCYGIDLATLNVVEKGETVGIIAAQSIGQPGTQLTMRTFHIGGTATTQTKKNSIEAPYPSYVRNITTATIVNKQGITIASKRGSIIIAQILESHKKSDFEEHKVKNGDKVISGQIIGIQKEKKKTQIFHEIFTSTKGEIVETGDEILVVGIDYPIHIDVGYTIKVEVASILKQGVTVCEYDPFNIPIITLNSGRVEFVDITEGINLKIEENVETGVKLAKIIPSRKEKLIPKVQIFEKAKQVEEKVLPLGSILLVQNGDMVEIGDSIAKIETQAEKNRDITGGLPRIGDLFESRHPKDACHIAEIDGIVRDFGEIVRDKRRLYIYPENVSEKEAEEKRVTVLIPIYKQVYIHDGDRVKKGDSLDEGPSRSS